MFIQVQGCNDGHEGRLRARRFWYNSEAVRVEVVESVDGSDPPDLDRVDEKGKIVGKRPDPHRIGRKSLVELQGDTCIRVMSDDLNTVPAEAAIEAAKKLTVEHAAKLSDAAVEISILTEENGKLRAQVADLEAKLAAKLSDAAVDVQPPAADAAAPTSATKPKK